jgi:hypothetical protein
MAEYTGKDLYLAWIHSGGTLVLSTDYRSFGEAPSIGMVDASAGADTHRTYLTTLKDGTYDYAGVHQTAGTVLKAALTEGAYGTLIIGPEGTATGKPKDTVPAISMGAQMSYPYDNIVEISVSFQKNGANVPSLF